MRGFAIQTYDSGEAPNSAAYKSLISKRRPLARVGWSRDNAHDLRLLAAERGRGLSKRWGQEKREAWKCRAFYEEVQEHDVLFYRGLREPGQVTVVRAMGPYHYLKPGRDFRSARRCKLISDSLPLVSSTIPSRLRDYLGFRGRMFEIPQALVASFLRKVGSPEKGGTDSGRGMSQRQRRAADLSRMKRRFKYAIGKQERTVNRAHLGYQQRLERFLEERVAALATFEEDHVDVQFVVGRTRFLGEVKVTNWLPLRVAFRTALGQILDYGHSTSGHRKGELIIFLDKRLDTRQLDLASRLKIAVVVEAPKGAYRLQNPSVSGVLRKVFAA